MSLYGAYGRALPVNQGGGGQTAAEILEFYYPNTSLTQDENVPDDIRVHLFSGLGATFTTSGPIDIKNGNDETFASLTEGTELTFGYGQNEFTITNTQGVDICIDDSGETPVNRCEVEPIYIELSENEPIQTDVISQFTNISTSGNTIMRRAACLSRVPTKLTCQLITVARCAPCAVRSEATGAGSPIASRRSHSRARSRSTRTAC